MNRRSSLNNVSISTCPRMGKSTTAQVIMPGEVLYKKQPISNPKRSVHFSQNVEINHIHSNSRLIAPSCSRRRFFFQQKQNSLSKKETSRILSDSNILHDRIKVASNIVPGLYPPQVEAQILNKMRLIALSKRAQGHLKESHHILKKVLDCQLVSLGCNHPQVANTFYHLGFVLNMLGRPETALTELEKGLRILFPFRHRDQNMDLAAILYEIGIIYGRRNDCTTALYYLDLSKQVEVHILGHGLDTTLRTIMDYETKAKNVFGRRSSV